MNDSQPADELSTKILHLWATLDTNATINIVHVTPLNRTELCENVVFLNSRSSLTLLMNNPLTANELPTKIILFESEAGHRRNHK